MGKLRALDKHLNLIPTCEDELFTGCELETIQCKFNYAGCEVQMPRKDMANHMKEQSYHIDLLAERVKKQNRELERLTMKFRSKEKDTARITMKLQSKEEETAWITMKLQSKEEETA